MCVNDLHSIAKFITGRGGSAPRLPDPTGVEASREDVVEAMALLHISLNRMFNRLNLDSDL